MDGKEQGIRTIVGGDFNARTKREEEGVTVMGEEGMDESKRQSRNQKVNKEGKLLMAFIKERE